MPNVRLSQSRQRLGSALIGVGAAITLVAWVALAVWTSIPWCRGHAAGMLVFATGVAVATNRVRCGKCGGSHWIVGEPTRLNCAHCGTLFFDEVAPIEPAG
jgi:NADH pyrophosphatase NudC (nudix superfamily)